MQLSYGPLRFQTNGVLIGVTKDITLGPDHQPSGEHVTWEVTGDWIATGPAACAAAAKIIDASVSIPGRDLIWRDGTGREILALKNRGSSTGVRCTRIQIPPEPSAWINSFPFVLIFEADYPYRLGGPQYTVWQESISMSGGLPLVIYKLAVNAGPQRQVVSPSTPYRLTQSGSATALGFMPRANFALPFSDLIDRQVTPSVNNGVYSISWSYTFESARPLVAIPRAIPR